MKNSCTFLLICLVFTAVELKAQQVTSLQSMHDGFVKNDGQVVDESGKTNDAVRFMYAGKGFNVAFREDGFSYEGFRVQKQPATGSESSPGQSDEEDDSGKESLIAGRIDVTFKGANAHPVMIADDPTGSVHHYYLNRRGPKGFTDVPVYRRITWSNLYDGIDLVFLYDENCEVSPVSYRFVVHEGAKVADIRMEYKGASGMALNSGNDLLLMNAIGEVQETSLRAYSELDQAPVAISRQLTANTATFVLDQPHQAAFVIDPNIVWSSYFGGYQFDYVGEVSYDKLNKVCIAGYTTSTQYIATTGAYQTTIAGGPEDVYVAQFNENGKLNWASYLGGNDRDYGYGITTDKNSNIIIVGKSQSDTGITTTGAYDEDGYANDADGDFLIAKFTRKGILLWSTLIGGESAENLRDVVCDSKGNIYTGGYTQSALNIKISNKNPSAYSGGGDGWLVKMSPNGFPSWSAYIGGNGQDRIHGIDIDQYGNVYVEGSAESDSGLATPGAYQVLYGGNTDAFIAKTDSTGNLLWATYYGGSGEDHGRGVVCDNNVAIYVAGYGNSAHTFGTPGVWQQNINSELDAYGNYSEDGFVAKFTYGGQRVWGTYYGGPHIDELLSIDRDDSSHIFVGGVTGSGDSIATPKAFQKFPDPNTNDAYFGIFDTTAKMLYGTFLGGPGVERLEDLTSGNNNNLYLAITTFGALPMTPGSWQTAVKADQDCAIYRFNSSNYCYDKFEPNETLAAAATLNLPDDSALYGYNARIAAPSDQDWFTFSTTDLEPNLKVTLTDLTKHYYAELYNGAGTLLDTSVANGNDQVLTWNGNTQATYYLHIRHDSLSYDALSCYRIELYKRPMPFFALVAMKPFNLMSGQDALDISFFPNPLDRTLHISGQVQNSSQGTLTIYNMMNEPVFVQQVSLSAGRVAQAIQLPQLAKGLYLFEWRQSGVVHREKIVVQ